MLGLGWKFVAGISGCKDPVSFLDLNRYLLASGGWMKQTANVLRSQSGVKRDRHGIDRPCFSANPNPKLGVSLNQRCD